MSRTYQYINLSYLHEISDQDQGFLTEMIASYIQKIPPQYQLLKESADAKNFEQVSFLAHKLKASFQMMGILQLVELAQFTEAESREKESPQIAMAVDNMNQILELAIAELKEELAILTMNK